MHPCPDDRDAPAPRAPWASHVGLCSVTLRQLTAEQVVAVARAAGLRCVEWGADVHAPPGDHGRLRGLRLLTEGAGMRVASYGSYWRAGVSSPSDVVGLATAATVLGAPRIRVWAGTVGTDAADGRRKDAVAAALRDACGVAREHGIRLSLEFHPDTLTDSVDSTLELLERVDDPALTTYWQPRLDEPTELAVAGLRRLLPALSGVHVFSWWPSVHRLPFAARTDLWTAVLDLLTTEAEPCDLLLEFVPGDDPALVAGEAETLRHLLHA